MRFKLKLKKSRQYNVTSRTSQVISVEHLIDSSSNVECTLSSESTGQECLENVCQRLSIGQPEFFGLRYLMKGYTNDYRWVDLEMPLSRQLEKFAATPRLFLRVMYYVVGGVHLLTDEATRYYYFLQVRGDVVDGRIQCDPAQAVLLAVCARHAEYDKTQRDQHTVDYLKAMLPLPRRYVEAGMAEKLAEEVLQHTQEMASVGQAAAEEMFLRTAQQLEGYGQERFPAKDRAGQEVLLGNSVLGIAVMYVADEEALSSNGGAAASTAVRFFNWRDISNVLNLKQSFIIECTQPENTCEFTLQDAESGRYFWKLCVLQHKFYSKYESIFGQHHQQQLPSPLTVLLQSMARQRSNSTISLMRRESNHTQNGGGSVRMGGGASDSCDNLLLIDSQQALQNWRNSDQHLAAQEGLPMAPHRWRSQDSVLMHQSHKSYSNLHLPNVMEVHQSPMPMATTMVNGQLRGLSQTTASPPMVTQTYNWQAIHSSAQKLASNMSLNGGVSGANHRILQGSSSCLDLTGNPATRGNNLISNSCTNVNSFNERENNAMKPMLPGYRKAPDYETAVMRQKYQRHVSGSQPDVYQASSSANTVANQVAAFHLMRQQQQQQQQMGQQKAYPPDVTQTGGNGQQQIYGNNNNSGNDQRYLNGGGGNVSGGGVNSPSVGGFKMNQIVQQQQQQQLRLMRLSNGNIIEEIKPPPPYPSPNRLSSTSTPDLALISHRSLLLGYRGSYVSGSSPDLVSSRTLLNNPHLMQLQHQQRNSASAASVGYMKSTSSIGPQNYYINGNGGGGGGAGSGMTATGSGGGVISSGMRHSHSFLPHGTYENLNCYSDQSLAISASHSNLYSHGSSSTTATAAATNGEHMVAAVLNQHQQVAMNGNLSVSSNNLNNSSQTQPMTTTNVSQSTAGNAAVSQQSQDGGGVVVQRSASPAGNNNNNNGGGGMNVIEPIYENLPLSCWSSSSGGEAAMTKASTGRRKSSGNGGVGATTQSSSNNTNQNQVTVTHTNNSTTGNGANSSAAAVSGSIVGGTEPTGTAVSGGLAELVHGSAEAQEMRDRASSVQSAPAGGVRGSYRSTTEEEDVVVRIVDSSEKGEKVTEVENKRPVSKTWSSPVNKNVFQGSIADKSSSTIIAEMTSAVNNGLVMKKAAAPPVAPSRSSESGKGKKKSGSGVVTTSSVSAETQLLNRSQSANLLDSSQFTDSGNISASTSVASIANSTAPVKEKKRGIWSILSRGKSSSSSSFSGMGSAKHKSATLGKSNKNLSLLTRDEEDNLKRWSTGLPRMEPLSANMSKEQLGRLLDQKKNDEESLFREFERIPMRKENARYECALHEENRSRNADSQCLPHDDNRVRLLPTRNNRQGYVNASHLSATVGSNQRFYIVAQSPFDAETMNSFWQCVWEADVYLIIQLSNELQYVPSSSDKCLEFGQYQVWREFSQETDFYVTSKLRIYHVQAKRYRIIWYIHYSDWSEQNIPRSVAPFLDFLEELSSVRMASVDEIPAGHNTNPPVLIHCNGSGGGRSGVTLAADLLLFTLDHNQDLDIPRVVGQLRHQRDNIVPSLVQYKFIYSLLIHYLKQTRLI